MARRKAKTTEDEKYLKALHQFYGQCVDVLANGKPLKDCLGPDFRIKEMAVETLERATAATSGPQSKMSEFQKQFLDDQDESRIEQTADATRDDPADLPVAEAVTKTLEEVYLAEELLKEEDEVALRLAKMEKGSES